MGTRGWRWGGSRFPVAVLLVVVALTETAMSADTLVTVDGDRIATTGPWEVKGRRVIYKDAKGTLSSFPVSGIDLEASRAATDAEAAQAEPEPQSFRKVPKRVSPALYARANRDPEAQRVDVDSGTSRTSMFTTSAEAERLIRQIPEDEAVEVLGNLVGFAVEMFSVDQQHDLLTVPGVRVLAQRMEGWLPRLSAMERGARSAAAKNFYRLVRRETELMVKMAPSRPRDLIRELRPDVLEMRQEMARP